LDDSHHDAKIAITIVKNLKKELEIARLTLPNFDNEDNCNEVRYLQFALNSGESKLITKKTKYNAVLLEWHLQVKLLIESCQAQKMMETHFNFQDEEDKLLDINGK